MEKFASKVLLFGEYSLLYDSMALTIPLDKFSGQFRYLDTAQKNPLAATFSNKGLRKLCNHMLEQHTDKTFQLNVRNFKTELERGLFFESNIPQGFGLGSSGALVAAIFLRYLEKAGEFKDEIKHLTKEKIGQLKHCLSTLESYFHGTSSGIDPLSSLMNVPLLLRSNEDIVKVALPPQRKNGQHVVFLFNTKLKRNTDQLVERFKQSCGNPSFKKKVTDTLTYVTNKSIDYFLNADTPNFYRTLRQLIQFQLAEMDYLIPESYRHHVKEGIEKGTYFLKICGSGGGGYMLGFTEDWKTTQAMLPSQDLEMIHRF